MRSGCKFMGHSIKRLLVCCLLVGLSWQTLAQQVPASAKVVDGVLTWASGPQQGKQVALFGVNYTLPFAYSYRALQKRGIDHKQAIDMDVDHIARLGFDAYRVHIWDREISDHQGNLLVNEHLDLFDYLLMKLAQRHIRVVITPIAWWGSGYPEPDPQEPGFAALYDKAQMNHNPQAIAAQHNYLRQLFEHVNPYTHTRYGDDPNVLAIELFNEPKHPDNLRNNVAYIDGLVNAVKQQGVDKPIFYNISEQGYQPEFAANLCASKISIILVKSL